MVEEKPMDFGGEPISQYDLISDDLIGKIKGLNPNLGRPMDEFGNGDPLYARFEAHRAEIENNELIIIDAEVLNRSSILNLDLAGDLAGVEELPTDFFQLIGDTLKIAFCKEEFTIDNIDGNEELEGYTSWSNTQFTPFNDGDYDN